jgi:hypothetical protein
MPFQKPFFCKGDALILPSPFNEGDSFATGCGAVLNQQVEPPVL